MGELWLVLDHIPLSVFHGEWPDSYSPIEQVPQRKEEFYYGIRRENCTDKNNWHLLCGQYKFRKTGVWHEGSFSMCEKRRILYVCQECLEMVKICLFFPFSSPTKLFGNVLSLRLHQWGRRGENRISKDACVWDFPGNPVVKTMVPRQRAWIWSLVWGLRSYMLRGQNKQKDTCVPAAT